MHLPWETANVIVFKKIGFSTSAQIYLKYFRPNKTHVQARTDQWVWFANFVQSCKFLPHAGGWSGC